MSLTFGAWNACECTDVQENRNDIPERCPEHGGYLLGTQPISDEASVGHSCTAAKNRGPR